MNSQAAEEPKNAGTGEDFAEVDSFLNSIALAKYKDRFIENGIEDEETILELNDEHLDSLSVPMGHKLKMLKRIKIIRSEKNMSVPESRQGQRPKPADLADGNGSVEVRPVSNNDYSELPAPKSDMGSNTGKAPVKSALKNAQPS